jgi:hypothetical protein
MEPSPSPAPRPSLKERLRPMIDRYGAVAVVVYVVIALSVFFGSYLAMQRGWKPESVAGTAGTWAAAYVFYKVTMIPRIGATVVLTPAVAWLLERLRLRKPRARSET